MLLRVFTIHTFHKIKIVSLYSNPTPPSFSTRLDISSFQHELLRTKFIPLYIHSDIAISFSHLDAVILQGYTPPIKVSQKDLIFNRPRHVTHFNEFKKKVYGRCSYHSATNFLSNIRSSKAQRNSEPAPRVLFWIRLAESKGSEFRDLTTTPKTHGYSCSPHLSFLFLCKGPSI